MWAVIRERSMLGECADPSRARRVGISISATSVLGWPVERNRARIGQFRWRLGFDRFERALVDQEFVKHILDRRLGLIGTGIAHVIMLETSIDDGNSSLLARFLLRKDAGIGFEDG